MRTLSTRREAACWHAGRAGRHRQVLQDRVDPAPALDAALDARSSAESVSDRHRSLRSMPYRAAKGSPCDWPWSLSSDQVVVPGRALRHLLQDRDHLVEAAERREGLDPGGPCVVGDLVVVDVVHVDAAGTAHHLLAHHGRVEVTQQAVAEGAQAGERPRAVHPRMDLEPPLARSPGTAPGPSPRWSGRCCGTRPSGRSRKRANTSRVRRDPRVTSRRLIVIDAFAASPVNRLEIDTPSSASRPRPVLARDSMMEASSGRLATRTRPSVAVVPAEGRHPVGAALQDGLLAGRRRAGQLHGPLVHRVRAAVEPAPQRRHRPGPQRPLHDREGDAVQLDEHDPVDVGVGDLRRA